MPDSADTAAPSAAITGERLVAPVDYSDLGFPGMPAEGWPEDPHDEDGYCEFCGNGGWKLHAPWCQWQDARDRGEVPRDWDAEPTLYDPDTGTHEA